MAYKVFRVNYHHSMPMFQVATALYFVVLNLGLLTLVAGDQFKYDKQHLWPMFLGSQCGELRQSPINIDTAQAIKINALIPLTFHNYDKPLDGEFENICHTVQFVPNFRATMAVSNHKGIYDLRRIQFRWGSDENQGSEHQLNGDKHAAEIQFVHLKRNVPPGSTDPDAYAIVAVLANSVPGTPLPNAVWSNLSVPIRYTTSNPVSGSSSQYESLLPTIRDSYYYYEGSFTTPLCTENVQWFVLNNTIDIPKGFLDDLRQVETDTSGTPLTFNYRDLQDLNARNVFEFP